MPQSVPQSLTPLHVDVNIVFIGSGRLVSLHWVYLVVERNFFDGSHNAQKDSVLDKRERSQVKKQRKLIS